MDTSASKPKTISAKPSVPNILGSVRFDENISMIMVTNPKALVKSKMPAVNIMDMINIKIET